MITIASGGGLEKKFSGLGLIGDVLCFILKISSHNRRIIFADWGQWDYSLLYCVLYFSADLNILQMKKKNLSKKKPLSPSVHSATCLAFSVTFSLHGLELGGTDLLHTVFTYNLFWKKKKCCWPGFAMSEANKRILTLSSLTSSCLFS